MNEGIGAFNALTERMDKMAARLADAECSVATNRQRIQAIDSDITYGAIGGLAHLTQKVRDLEQHVRDGEAFDELRNGVGELDVRAGDAEHRLDNIGERLDHHRTRLNDLEQKLPPTVAVTPLADHMAEHNELLARLKELDNDQAKLNQVQQNTRERLQELEARTAEHMKWSNHPGEYQAELEAQRVRETLHWAVQKLSHFGLHSFAKDVDEILKRLKQELVR